ncbi:thioredoxin family protein [Aureibacillus halotolerans]|uniref:Thioredoxin-like protein n=1 Tax=Aureibacillus halotolerans TaxID=1508390 RepID=A0A4R6U946_9BACI|nr:thioredoxin family protein [Aureibacillus halotolerans]TDQ42951.1 thioredoxin-like protein [Aureibacillus halotolerans]
MNLNQWFDKGMDYETYVASMTVKQDELLHIYKKLAFTKDDLLNFESLRPKNLRCIVLSADWCGDAALCVPIFQRIAEESNITLHFLLRDDNLELMDQYLTNGTSRSIPKFIFINEAGHETMVWGPRSPQWEEEITRERSALPDKSAPNYDAMSKEMYARFKTKRTSDPFVWKDVINDFKRLL